MKVWRCRSIKASQNANRVFAVLLMLCLMVNNVAMMAGAAPDTGIEEEAGSDYLVFGGSNWYTKPVSAGLTAHTKESAANIIAKLVTVAGSSVSTALSADDSIPGGIMYYGKCLIALDWVASNGFRGPTVNGSASDSSGDGLAWYNVFANYRVTDSEDTAAGLLDVVYHAYSALTKKSDQLPIGTLSVAMEPSSAILAGGSTGAILGSNTYRDAFNALLKNYVDYNILRILAEDNGIAEDIISSGDAGTLASILESDVFTGDYLQRVQANNYEFVTTILSGGKAGASTMTRIAPYLRILQEWDDTCHQVYTMVGATSEYPDVNNPEELIRYIPVGRTTEYPLPNAGISKVSLACWLTWSATKDVDSALNTPIDKIEENLDLSKGLLEAIANVRLNTNGVYISDGTDKITLTTVGWAVLACGVVYEPFVSHAGDTNYKETLKCFVGEKYQEDLYRLLREAYNTRKPLYYSENPASNWWGLEELQPFDVATCYPATLATLFHDDKSLQRAYFMIKGTMRTSYDSSTFEYVQSMRKDSLQDGNTIELDQGQNNSAVSNGSSGFGGEFATTGGVDVTLSKEQVTRPIMFTTGRANTFQSTSGKGLYAGIGGLTELILVNARQDCKSDLFDRADQEYLFVNGLGDIVLSDGTIVLPAVANPALWNYSTNYMTTETERDFWGLGGHIPDWVGDAGEWASEKIAEIMNNYNDYRYKYGLGPSGTVSTSNTDEDTVVEGTIGDVEYPAGVNYYPYNVAFSNHYPRLRIGVEGAAVTATSKADIGKMVLSQTDSIAVVSTIEDIKDNGSVVAPRNNEIKAMPIQGMCFAPGQDETSVVGMYTMGFSTASGEAAWHIWNGKDTMFVAPAFKLASTGQPFFPLLLDNEDVLDSYIEISRAVALACMRYMTSGVDSTTRSDAGTANIELWVEDMVGQAMLGNSYSEQIIKNFKIDYESIVNDQHNRFVIFIRDIVKNALDTFGHIDGVLAMKDGYTNKFFNIIVGFVQEFYIILLVIVLLVVAIKFLRGRYNMVYICFIGLFAVASFQVYAVWMPTAVPAVYNMFVNDIVEDIVWSSITVKAEHYSYTYGNSSRVDAMTGAPRPYTATISLYKLTNGEIETVASRLNEDVSDIQEGKIIYLDRTAGIFLQGDTIKMSVDSLFVNNTLRGLYETQWASINANVEEIKPIDVTIDGNPYIVKLTEPYVSLEAYYTPFCQFERAFVVNLNNFTNIFRIQRNSNNYGDNLSKDAFLFNAFTNSGIFLDPNSDTTDTTLMQNVNVEDITAPYMADVVDVVMKCHLYLDPFEDWLNLRSVFVNPSDAMKESLWGKMMLRRGYYNSDWSMNEEQEEAIASLVKYINEHTKQFVIRNQNQLNFCSDENAIKLTTLYATTCFTHRVSEFGYWLYPNYVNADDIELVDALYGSMTTIRDQNTAMSDDVVNVVANRLGLLGLLMLLLIVVLSVVFIFVMTYLIPILYVLLGAIILFKLGGDDGSFGPVKGYIKVTAVTVVLYCCYSVGLRCVKWYGYQWYGYLLCAIVSALCVYFLSVILFSIIVNPLEMGNDVLLKNMFSALNRLTGNRLNRLTTNNLTVNANHRYDYGNTGFNSRNFLRRSPIDSIIPQRFGRRRTYYNRSSGLDDSYYDSRRYSRNYPGGYRNGGFGFPFRFRDKERNYRDTGRHYRRQ